MKEKERKRARYIKRFASLCLRFYLVLRMTTNPSYVNNNTIRRRILQYIIYMCIIHYIFAAMTQFMRIFPVKAKLFFIFEKKKFRRDQEGDACLFLTSVSLS